MSVIFLIAILCEHRIDVKECQTQLVRCTATYGAVGANADENTLLLCLAGSCPDIMKKSGKCPL